MPDAISEPSGPRIAKYEGTAKVRVRSRADHIRLPDGKSTHVSLAAQDVPTSASHVLYAAAADINKLPNTTRSMFKTKARVLAVVFGTFLLLPRIQWISMSDGLGELGLKL